MMLNVKFNYQSTNAHTQLVIWVAAATITFMLAASESVRNKCLFMQFVRIFHMYGY